MYFDLNILLACNKQKVTRKAVNQKFAAFFVLFQIFIYFCGASVIDRYG